MLSVSKPDRRWAQLALAIVAQRVKQAAETNGKRLYTRGVDEHLLIEVAVSIAWVDPDYPHRPVIARWWRWWWQRRGWLGR